ncbi:lysophospholipid acyltransferase 1-like isoform X1 [Hydractinia symbiolongicarpus]|uniref:lysophospholipid acyltransferase 1-like isoform X1 n=1 Tax=Hydractinia symbiolongicarpus TaxID=13093 RepID=UPI00254C1026|nr:lysophospholipid acyltransferase 1-like isoform X1 [Hydractinia symbiolongicarpus]
MAVMSNVFHNLKDITGLTYDQVKFVVTVFLCLPLSYIFRTCCSTKTISPATRHYLSLICGAGLLTFCFGRQAVHLLLSSVMSYILMLCIDEAVVHRYVFVCAMTYLSVIHINRMLTQNGYVIDISGPLMLATIKITYVGFNIHDAFMLKREDENKPTKPTLLEYLSYIFGFTTVFCGPPPEFQDYKAFIEETQYIKFTQQKKIPSPVLPALAKSVLGYAMVACYAILVPYYEPHFLGNKERLANSSLLSNILFAEMVIYLNKAKYFSPFLIGEGVGNMAGLGFNGYDKNGNPLWNKLQNMNPFGLEIARNIKEKVECWNIVTNRWLKKCIYNRTRHMPLLMTWFFSAFWHGFYPGYYMFFVPVGVGLFVARKMRRKVRPYFLHSPARKIFYDVVTLLCTRMIVSFYAAAFTMMDARATLRFWRGAYYYGHVILVVGLVLIFILPDAEVLEGKQNGVLHMPNGSSLHDKNGFTKTSHEE